MLDLSAQFVEWGRPTLPPRFALRVEVANVGRRPATPTSVTVKFRPNLPLYRRFRRSTWTTVTRLSYCDSRFSGGTGWPPTIEEAKTFSFEIIADALPPGFTVADIQRVGVRDTAGNVWRSGKISGSREVASLLSVERLREQTFASAPLFGTEIGVRTVLLRAFRLPESVVLELTEDPREDRIRVFCTAEELEMTWTAVVAVVASYVKSGFPNLKTLLRERGLMPCDEGSLLSLGAGESTNV